MIDRFRSILVGPGFVRCVIERGRGPSLLRGVVAVRPYSAPCGTFGRHVRLWRLLVPFRSLKGHTTVRPQAPVVRDSENGVAAWSPRSHEAAAPFSNVCIREQRRAHNGGCAVKENVVKYQMSAELPTKHQHLGVAPLGNLDE